MAVLHELVLQGADGSIAPLGCCFRVFFLSSGCREVFVVTGFICPARLRFHQLLFPAYATVISFSAGLSLGGFTSFASLVLPEGSTTTVSHVWLVGLLSHTVSFGRAW